MAALGLSQVRAFNCTSCTIITMSPEPVELCQAQGLLPIRFHDLRHTAATLMLLKGIHPKVVSEMLGHTTIGITLDLYSHVLPDMQREAAAAMDELLQEQVRAHIGVRRYELV